MTFYDCRTLRALIDEDDPGGSLPPDIATPTQSTLVPREFLKEDDSVAVRVDLGAGVHGDSTRVATKTASALITVAQAQTGSSGWQSTGNSIVFRGGQFRSAMRTAVERPAYSFHQDRVGDALSARAADFLGHLPLSAAFEAISDSAAEWLESRESGTSARIIFDVRFVERTSSLIGGGTWEQFLRALYRHDWVIAQLFDDLAAGINGIQADTAPQHMHAVEVIIGNTYRSEIRGSFTIDHAVIFDSLPFLVEAVRADSLRGRQLREIRKVFGSTASLSVRRAALEGQFDSRLERTARIRNSLTHGGPATAAAIEATAPFSGSLGARTLGIAMEATLTGSDLAVAFADTRAKAAGRYDALATAGTVRDGLFGTT